MNIYLRAIQTWGRQPQIIKALEELAELSVELAKWANDAVRRSNLITEIADVEIMLEQLKIMLHAHDEIEQEVKRKLERLGKRLNESKKRLTADIFNDPRCPKEAAIVVVNSNGLLHFGTFENAIPGETAEWFGIGAGEWLRIYQLAFERYDNTDWKNSMVKRPASTEKPQRKTNDE